MVIKILLTWYKSDIIVSCFLDMLLYSRVSTNLYRLDQRWNTYSEIGGSCLITCQPACNYHIRASLTNTFHVLLSYITRAPLCQIHMQIMACQDSRCSPPGLSIGAISEPHDPFCSVQKLEQDNYVCWRYGCNPLVRIYILFDSYPYAGCHGKEAWNNFVRDLNNWFLFISLTLENSVRSNGLSSSPQEQQCIMRWSVNFTAF